MVSTQLLIEKRFLGWLRKETQQYAINFSRVMARTQYLVENKSEVVKSDW